MADILAAGTDRSAVTKKVGDKKLGYAIVIGAPRQPGRAAWGDPFDGFAVQQILITNVAETSGNIVAWSFGRDAVHGWSTRRNRMEAAVSNASGTLQRVP